MDVSSKNLGISIGGAEILEGIDINAGPGEFIGVIGPNGSGKSTLLKCIYKLLKPNSGAVFLDGKSLSEYTARESSRKIAVVAQHSIVSFDFTVLEMAMMGRSPHKRPLERDNSEDYRIARDALGLVGMSAYENRSFSTLSGGEKQRVILARALAQQTPCLILDEPTNHLDIKYQLQLMRIVKESGRTIISAIHDLNIALAYCDYAYVLLDGRVYAQGPPISVLTESLIWDVYGVKSYRHVGEAGVSIAFSE